MSNAALGQADRRRRGQACAGPVITSLNTPPTWNPGAKGRGSADGVIRTAFTEP